jgi:hypothetical protein
MVTVEFPKEERKAIKYSEMKKCLLKRELGELDENCKNKFKEWKVED